jgi:hypothetical protein
MPGPIRECPMTKPRLELTWIGKDTRPKLEPRILIEDPAKSYHAAARVGDQESNASPSGNLKTIVN